jgi:hypothetical protein
MFAQLADYGSECGVVGWWGHTLYCNQFVSRYSADLFNL